MRVVTRSGRPVPWSVCEQAGSPCRPRSWGRSSSAVSGSDMYHVGAEQHRAAGPRKEPAARQRPRNACTTLAGTLARASSQSHSFRVGTSETLRSTRRCAVPSGHGPPSGEVCSTTSTPPSTATVRPGRLVGWAKTRSLRRCASSTTAATTSAAITGGSCPRPMNEAAKILIASRPVRPSRPRWRAPGRRGRLRQLDAGLAHVDRRALDRRERNAAVMIDVRRSPARCGAAGQRVGRVDPVSTTWAKPRVKVCRASAQPVDGRGGGALHTG